MDHRAECTEYAGLTRRQVLGGALAGAAGLSCGGAALASALAAHRGEPGKARSVIQIWLWGGPCHIDTFDPKPGAGPDYTGPLDRAIPTNVDGIQIGELLPELAKQAHRYSLIRGMTHGINGHETASYLVQTGQQPGTGLVYPGVGAVVSLFKGYSAGYKGLIPPYIVLTQLQGRFSEPGFLGYRAKPFATGGDPNAPRFAVEGVVAAGITEQRQRNRRELLHRLDTLRNAIPRDSHIAALARSEDQAYDLILGDAGKVFNPAEESEEVRSLYGRNTFGQSCLVARRLVEKGVPMVTINFQGWDTHRQHFQIMRQKLPQLDRGLAALLQDLDSRGLLASTLIWCGGEFGRTPRVQWEAPWNGGRNHHGAVFSVLVAGGGFRGGHVVGASDARGEAVKERPVYPVDLIRSMYELLGIDPQARLPHPQGLDVRVAGDYTREGGRLSEIM